MTKKQAIENTKRILEHYFSEQLTESATDDIAEEIDAGYQQPSTDKEEHIKKKGGFNPEACEVCRELSDELAKPSTDREAVADLCLKFKFCDRMSAGDCADQILSLQPKVLSDEEIRKILGLHHIMETVVYRVNLKQLRAISQATIKEE